MDDKRLTDSSPRVPTPAAHDAHPGSCQHCGIARRTALMGLGAVGLAGILAACGGDGETTADSSPQGAPEDTGSPDAGPTDPPDATATSEVTPTEEPAEPTSEQTEGSAEAIATTDQVPVGSGFINDRVGVVVTQPAAGQFVAFSTTCTHQGCAVTEVGDGLITCTCHGSQYSVIDGSVQQGPAQQSLEEVPIVVEGTQILPG